MLLHKYMSRDSFFTNFKLRLTPPNELNDPRECFPEIKLNDPRGYISHVIQRNFERGYWRLLLENPGMTPAQALVACIKASSMTEQDFEENNETWVQRIFDMFMKVTNKNLGILSLTETNDNELMWSHYANSHTGFLVSFDSEHSFFKPTKDDPKVCGEMMNVQYTDTIPTVYVQPGELDIPKELFFTKTTKWSYEREWRMLKLLTAANEIVSGNIHLFEVPRDAVKEVAFGMKVQAAVRTDIEQKLKASAPHVIFRKAGLNLRGQFGVA